MNFSTVGSGRSSASSPSKLFAVLFVVGFVLVFIGFAVQGLDIGSCPAMGYGNVTSVCYHTFLGTDIPITVVGNVLMFVGGLLIAATIASTLYGRYIKSKPSPNQ